MRHALRVGVIALALAGLLPPAAPATADQPADRSAAQPADRAAAPADEAAEGTSYAYLVGHPMLHTYGGTALGGYLGHCTGGYAVAGTSGTFVLGARGCVVVLATVRGTDREFGVHAHSGPTSVLVRVTPPDDAFQLVVDPTTGEVPAGGWVQGYVPTHEQGEGVLVGKMGIGSGWTEGRITGWIDFEGNRAICTTARTAPGDAGGPVWRADEHGLRAVGVVVAYHPGTGEGCYLPIQGLLSGWGAWLPVPAGPVHVDGPGTFPDGLPQLDATGFTTPLRYVPIGG